MKNILIILNILMFNSILSQAKSIHVPKVISCKTKILIDSNLEQNGFTLCISKNSIKDSYGYEDITKSIYLLNHKKLIFVDRYFAEGNPSNIEKVFLLHKLNKVFELAVLVSWKQKVDTTEGVMYKVYIYHIEDKDHKVTVTKLDNLFNIEFEGYQEEKYKKAHYLTKKDIEHRLEKITNLPKLLKTIKKSTYLKIGKQIVEELLYRTPLTPKTLTQYNNIAYYLQKAGANEEAIYLLEKIIKKFPNRTVAYINLGDAYWALGEKQKAKKAYTTYIEQMCTKGLQKKIPKQVLERIKQNNDLSTLFGTKNQADSLN